MPKCWLALQLLLLLDRLCLLTDHLRPAAHTECRNQALFIGLVFLPNHLVFSTGIIIRVHLLARMLPN